MTTAEAWEILRKYDRPLYDWLEKNAWYMGGAYMAYAEKLKEENENGKRV